MTQQEILIAAVSAMNNITYSQHPSGALLLQAGEARMRVSAHEHGWTVTPPGAWYRETDKLVHHILLWGWHNSKEKKSGKDS